MSSLTSVICHALWLVVDLGRWAMAGDLNESFHPIRILREAGFQDCFTRLGLPLLPTHPDRPSSPEEDRLVRRHLSLPHDRDALPSGGGSYF
jgi:hypothetical protein